MSWIATPESSSIAGFEYVEERRMLIVEFKSGARYNYFDVPAAIYEGMKAASSRGQFHAKNVVNKYRYAKV